jgi:hypothetical protein
MRMDGHGWLNGTLNESFRLSKKQRAKWNNETRCSSMSDRGWDRTMRMNGDALLNGILNESFISFHSFKGRTSEMGQRDDALLGHKRWRLYTGWDDLPGKIW